MSKIINQSIRKQILLENIVIKIGDSHDPKIAALLQASHAMMEKLFPLEDNLCLSIDDFCAPDIQLFVAQCGEAVLGCVGLANRQSYGEIKSMFVSEDARNLGIASMLMDQIDKEAGSLKLPVIKLETGNKLGAAQNLYTRHGFIRCGPFGDYKENGSSVFMEKIF